MVNVLPNVIYTSTSDADSVHVEGDHVQDHGSIGQDLYASNLAGHRRDIYQVFPINVPNFFE